MLFLVFFALISQMAQSMDLSCILNSQTPASFENFEIKKIIFTDAESNETSAIPAMVDCKTCLSLHGIDKSGHVWDVHKQEIKLFMQKSLPVYDKNSSTIFSHAVGFLYKCSESDCDYFFCGEKKPDANSAILTHRKAHHRDRACSYESCYYKAWSNENLSNHIIRSHIAPSVDPWKRSYKYTKAEGKFLGKCPKCSQIIARIKLKDMNYAIAKHIRNCIK